MRTSRRRIERKKNYTQTEIFIHRGTCTRTFHESKFGLCSICIVCQSISDRKKGKKYLGGKSIRYRPRSADDIIPFDVFFSFLGHKNVVADKTYVLCRRIWEKDVDPERSDSRSASLSSRRWNHSITTGQRRDMIYRKREKTDSKEEGKTEERRTRETKYGRVLII